MGDVCSEVTGEQVLKGAYLCHVLEPQLANHPSAHHTLLGLVAEFNVKNDDADAHLAKMSKLRYADNCVRHCIACDIPCLYSAWVSPAPELHKCIAGKLTKLVLQRLHSKGLVLSSNVYISSLLLQLNIFLIRILSRQHTRVDIQNAIIHWKGCFKFAIGRRALTCSLYNLHSSSIQS